MRKLLCLAGAIALVGLFVPAPAQATHAWNGYHWARTSNPFTIQLIDKMSSVWDPSLALTSADWSASSVLDTTIVSGGGSARSCSAVNGKVKVCNAAYGTTGWLGIAQIWIDGQQHITRGTAKMNDTYFNSPPYNTTPWRNLVTCQEVGHTFGLAHQDENFTNPNLGTCMDYTNDPDGPPSNEHPNAHDYEQLEIIYAHLDSYTTVGGAPALAGGTASVGERASWGREVSRSADGRSSTFQRDLGNGAKLITYVIWA